MAVLCILYGLWLVMDTPAYVESMIVGGVILLLYALAYIRSIPRVFDFALGVDQDQQLSTVKRTSIIGARELLRLVFLLALGRGIFMLGGFLWSLYLNGYTETVFEIQHIWADHLFAGRIISIANKGYAVETVEAAGRYFNLLYPPLYSLIVRLISPVYLSSLRAGFFVSNLNAILSGVVLYLLVLHDSDRRSAVRALWYYSILPPSFLLTCTIPASTFLLLSLMSIYFARRKRFVLSSLLGAMAALTERVGIVLVIPLLLEGGSFFAYVECLEELYSSQFALFYRVCGVQTERLIDAYRTFDRAHALGLYLPSLLVAVGSLALILVKGKELRASYLAFFMVYYAVILSQTGVMDGPRQLFCCFPIIIALMRFTKNRLLNLLMSLLCIAGSVFYLGMYVAGWPVV